MPTRPPTNRLNFAIAACTLCGLLGTAVGGLWNMGRQSGVEIQRAAEQERRIEALERRFDYEFGRDTTTAPHR